MSRKRAGTGLVADVLNLHTTWRTVGGQHPKLNLLNLEAVAVAVSTGAHILLAQRAAVAILPDVLEAEQVDWSSDL